jgi:hypothetical protein
MCKYWSAYNEVFDFGRSDRGEFRNSGAYELTPMYSIADYVDLKCSCVLCLRVNTAVVGCVLCGKKSAYTGCLKTYVTNFSWVFPTPT